MIDEYGREIDYIRISVTDRCNLRCKYCMPNGIECVGHKDILSFEEIRQIAACGAKLGITKIRLTGGEPLARKGCPQLIRMLKEIPGMEKIAMTTNGTLVRAILPQLVEAGLDEINISLDTLDAEAFAQITGQDLLPEVLKSIDASLEAGLKVKVNAVSMPDTDWRRMVSLAKEKPVDVRFIELMPIGAGKQSKGRSNEELLEEISNEYPELQADNSVHGAGPAVYYKIPGFQGSIGLISAMHGKFCASCNRVRLTSTGFLKTCLCYEDGVDLRKILRKAEDGKTAETGTGREWNKAVDESVEGNAVVRASGMENPDMENRELLDAMGRAIYGKPAGHCFEHPDQITEAHGMSAIGG